MRKFNIAEKAIIKKMVNDKDLIEQGMLMLGRFIEKNYYGPEKNTSLFMVLENNKVYISGPQGQKEFLPKIVFTVTLFKLIMYLQKEGLIYIVGNLKQSGGLGEQYKQGTTTELSPDISEIVINSFHNLILISEDLRFHVDNNFKTQNQIRHKQTIIFSYIAIAVSIILGLLGFLNSLPNK